MPTSQPMTFLISASGGVGRLPGLGGRPRALGLEGPGAQERPFFPPLWVGAQWAPRAAVHAPVQARGLPVAVLGVVLLMEEGALVIALADALHPDDGAVGPDPVPLGEGEGAAAGAEIVGIEVVDLAAVLAFHSPHGTILSLALGAVTGSVCSLRTV